MIVQERELIESGGVRWLSYNKKWNTYGKLNIGKYEIKIPESEHDSIDDALEAFKEAMSKAVIDFDPLTQEKGDD